jgi:hypothetical protein
VEQTRLEKLAAYEDRWPLLNFRKFLIKVSIIISSAAEAIISHKAFETASICVILLNCF